MENYFLKSNIVFGAGSIDKLSDFKGKNVSIVTDPAMKTLGLTDNLEKIMVDCNVTVFSDIKPDPTIGQVISCYNFIKAKKADIVIAFGGGSAIDTVKTVVMTEKKANPNTKLYFIAIPTTSGTGSEVTNYTVVTNEETGRKCPMADDSMIPDMAILDYTLTKSVPASVTADTGMDAITHAIEAYVSVGANVITDSFAEKAMDLAFSNLYTAYKDGNNDEARENMQMASYLAGVAFNKAGLGINHSIAHALGANFHIPHGRANAIVLPYVIAFNASMDVMFGADNSETAKKYAQIARKIGLPKAGTRLSVQYLIQEINNLQKKMQIPTTLLQNGVKRDDFKERRSAIIDAVLADLCTICNPRVPDAGDIGKLIDRIFGGF